MTCTPHPLEIIKTYFHLWIRCWNALQHWLERVPPSCPRPDSETAPLLILVQTTKIFRRAEPVWDAIVFIVLESHTCCLRSCITQMSCKAKFNEALLRFGQIKLAGCFTSSLRGLQKDEYFWRCLFFQNIAQDISENSPDYQIRFHYCPYFPLW